MSDLATFNRYHFHHNYRSLLTMTELDEKSQTSPVPDLSLAPPPALTSLIPGTQVSASPNDALRPKSTVLQTTIPSIRDKVWTFLSSCSVPRLRTICKIEGIVQRARKKQDVMMRVLKKVCDFGVQTSLWETHSTESERTVTESEQMFHEWAAANSNRVRWIMAPEITPTFNDEFSDSPTNSTNFTIHEFARLIILLSSNNELRTALLNSGNELTRDQLDRRVSRDEFWTTVVAPVFNDASATVDYEFPDELSIINAMNLSTVSRTGTELKRHYCATRSHFTLAYDRWSRSRQNDPHNFSQFCGTNSIGKKSHVLFVVLRCAERNERNDILDFTLRTIPPDAMVDSGELILPARLRPEKRRSLKKNANDTLGDSIGELHKVLKSHRSSQLEARNHTSRTELLKQLELIMKMRRELQDDEVDEKDLLAEQLLKVKRALRSISD